MHKRSASGFLLIF